MQTEKYIENLIGELRIDKYAVHKILPEKNIIKIDQIRQMESLTRRAYEGRKLIIVYSFDSARVETLNAALKTLEEDFVKAQFVLIVEDESHVLDTIISRCRIYKIKKDLPAASSSEAHVWKSNDRIDKDSAIAFLDDMLFEKRKEIINKNPDQTDIPKTIKLVKEILGVRQLIQKNNLNPLVAVDHINIFAEKIFAP